MATGLVRLFCLASFFHFAGLLLVRRDADVLFLELSEVTLCEEKAVLASAGEDLILKAEISHSKHGERFIHFRINEQPSVITQSYDLWEQSPVLCTVENDQMATLKGSLMERHHVHMLE